MALIKFLNLVFLAHRQIFFMKKIYFLFLLLAVSFSSNSQLLTENFNYAAGQLITNNGWTAHSVGGTNPILVTAPGLTYAGHTGSGVGNAVTLGASGEDDNKTFTAVSSGKVYYSFLINVSSATATGDYCVGLLQNATLFPHRVYVKSDGAGGFFFGLAKLNSTPIVYETTSRSFGTTYFVVGNYIFNTATTTDDALNLWVNPALGGTETTPAIANVTGASTDAPTISAVFLRQGGAATSSIQQIDAFLVGTTWEDVTPTSGGSPTLTATALTAFGNVCLNANAGPNSFTITGTTLTNANVTVGALSGFTYSTTAGGTYTASLSLSQPGGAYSQQIFVRFIPTLVQSYNGNIPVGGGGATAINVAAAGSGVNTIPTVTSGTASAITSTSATVAGTIPSNGCSAITAYGIEWSITNGFPNGGGTAVVSTNLSGINFSSNLAGLLPGVTYYYHAYATNAGGTAYGTQGSFTTVSAPALSVSALTGFGNVCINTTAGPNSFTITGTNLTAANVTVAALNGFTYSTTAGGTYTTTLSLTQPGGSYSQQIFVKFDPTLVQLYNGNIAVGGGGATAINVAATGAGVNSVPTVTTGAASAITTNSVTLAGAIPSNGCSAVTAYGVEYSTTAGFPNGTGTAVASTNLSGVNFSSNVAGLTPNTVYYYHAYATNGGGTGYGNEQTFTTLALTPTLNATALTAFGNVCLNTIAGPNSFTINGSALNTTNISVGPLTGFTFSTTSGGTYTASLNLTQPGGTYTQAIFVRFTPTLVQSYNGNIPVSGGGAAAITVAAVGAGINTLATVASGAASAITSISATVAGTIPSNGCSAITTYGIEYSTTNGFPNGSGTAVASTNLAGINFSSNLTGLTPTTVYYFHAYATNNGGTAYGAQGTFTTATPTLSSSALTGFGNVCLNNTVGPNSFTVTGTFLTTANVTVAALPGFTYSTTTGGTYTTTLSLTQPSGAYSQQIFVKFTPTAVQSYNGNIAVGGGGGATVNVAATGAGVNTAPSVTAGLVSAITQTTATVAGTIPANGCTAVTAYGIEFSTINAFPNGTGTAVASTNLSGVNFSSALTGLAPSTTYYYHAYATNAGGTTYSTQGSFTTAAPVLTATPLTAFGANCINTTVGPNSFVINSNAVTAANINVGPLAGYTFSTTSGGIYTASLSITHAAGAFTQNVFVKFTPTAVQSYNGNIPVSGGGAPVTVNVVASGSGVNTVASVVTGAATLLSPNAVTLAGNVSNIGCSAVITYGIEYSGISGLANGLGTRVFATNLSGGNFSATVTGLVQGGKYYYKAWAINNGGIAYGAELSFTMSSIPDGFKIYSVPVQRGTNLHYTYKGIKPGHYQVQIINSIGQSVFQHELIIPVNFIDDNFVVPGNIPAGVYSLRISSPDFRDDKVFMIR
jgi:hypothetical protein